MTGIGSHFGWEGNGERLRIYVLELALDESGEDVAERCRAVQRDNLRKVGGGDLLIVRKIYGIPNARVGGISNPRVRELFDEKDEMSESVLLYFVYIERGEKSAVEKWYMRNMVYGNPSIVLDCGKGG